MALVPKLQKASGPEPVVESLRRGELSRKEANDVRGQQIDDSGRVERRKGNWADTAVLAFALVQVGLGLLGQSVPAVVVGALSVAWLSGRIVQRLGKAMRQVADLAGDLNSAPIEERPKLDPTTTTRGRAFVDYSISHCLHSLSLLDGPPARTTPDILDGPPVFLSSPAPTADVASAWKAGRAALSRSTAELIQRATTEVRQSQWVLVLGMAVLPFQQALWVAPNSFSVLAILPSVTAVLGAAYCSGLHKRWWEFERLLRTRLATEWADVANSQGVPRETTGVLTREVVNGRLPVEALDYVWFEEASESPVGSQTPSAATPGP